jgi:hypothetical protein
MKTLLIIPAIIILVFTASCRKKRTCTCTSTTTITDTYPNGSTDTDVYSSSTTVTAEKQTKKYFRMDNTCYDYSERSTDNNSGYTEVRTSDVSCTLK